VKINTKLKIAALAPILMAIVISIALLFSFRMIEQSRENGQTARRIMNSMNELNNFAHSYMLYHEERPKVQFLLEHEAISGLISNARFGKKERAMLQGIRRNNESVRSSFLNLVSYYEGHGPAASHGVFREAEERLAGQVLIRLRAVLSDALRLEDRVGHEITVTQKIINTLIFFLIVTTTFPLTIVLIRMMRRINSSLTNLRVGTEIIGSGNLAHRIGLGSDDEIGELSRAFDRMAAHLQSVTVSKDQLQNEVDERIRVEEALREAHDELEQRVRERTAELREKDQLLMLQNRQAAMGEMISNIAHQWRQPLNGLGLLIQSLPMVCEKEGFNTGFLEVMSEKAMQLILHMSQTIDDFRNYFKPDKEMVLFNVSQPVSRTINLIEESFKNLKIVVEVNVMEDPVLNGYPNEFAQVLLNILINARDAMVERTVSDPKIRITTSTQNGKAVVTINDNGGGIPENLMGRIFEPYFTTKAPDRGTGIGLFMSKTIIEKNMGGKLLARNSADGAEFRIEV
jgi:signal transduction histidine kinase